jgi:hypothetical protein
MSSQTTWERRTEVQSKFKPSPYSFFFVEENDLDEKTTCNGVEKKVVIVDCRSYTVAFANRAKGGGMECTGILLN